MDCYAATLRERGGEHELALLGHVREILRPVLGEDAAGDGTTPIDSFEALIKAARRCANGLRIRTLFKGHRELLDEEALQKLQMFAAEPTMLEPATRWERMKLLYIAALVVGDPATVARSYLMRGSAYRGFENFAKAARMFERGARMAEKLDDPFLKGGILGAQASLYRRTGNLSRAIEVYEQVLAIALEGRDVFESSVRESIADCCRGLGRYSRALDEIDRAIALGDRSEPAAMQVRRLRLRGLILDHLGRHESALADYEAGLKLAGELKDKGSELMLMSDVAAVYAKRGLNQMALRLFRRALRQAELSANPIAVASAHNNLGTVFLAMNRPAEALAEFKKALHVKANTGGEGEWLTLRGMAQSLAELGDAEGAKTFRTIALLPALESGSPLMLATAMVWDFEGKGHGSSDEDLKSLEQAVEYARAGGSRLHELVIVRELGERYVGRGEVGKALDLYRRVLAEGGVAEPSVALEQLMVEVAFCRLLARDPGTIPESLGRLQTLLGVIESEIEATLLDERRSEIVGHARSLYDALIDVILKSDGPGRSFEGRSAVVFAFELHEAAKSRSFLSLLADAPLDQPAAIPAELSRRESELLREKRDLQTVDEVQSETFRIRRLTEIAKELRTCWKQTEAYAPRYVRLRSGQPLTYLEIQAEVTQHLDEKTAVISLYCGEDTTTVFVLRRGWSEPWSLQFSVGRAECEKLAGRLRRAFNGAPEEFPPYPPIRRDRPFQRDLSFLDRLGGQLGPLFLKLEDAELIHLVPHGPYHLIPFHALRLPCGGYVAERFTMVYWPSISTVFQLLSRQRPAREKPRSGVLKSILRRATSLGRQAAGSDRPQALVGGIAAAGDVHPEYFERDADILSGTPCEVTLAFGAQSAARSQLLAALPRHDIVHLSCHGFFDSADPLGSGLLVSDGRRNPPRDPWSLSVLERRTFLVTARDLLQTRLASRLVTLNACSTGLQGERNAGDELDGFGRSLLLAGASSVILTLWNVDQRTSRDFLAGFYRRWLNAESVPKWRAFHEEQRAFLRADEVHLQHPYHWAPFVLMGDWR